MKRGMSPYAWSALFDGRPGRCPRCGEEKSWLRPGETCARCLVPSGPPPRREWDDEEDEVETITLPTNGVYSTGD